MIEICLSEIVQATIRQKNYDAGVAKSRLIDIMAWLESEGFERDAKSLGTIIGKLEEWQNKTVKN